MFGTDALGTKEFGYGDFVIYAGITSATVAYIQGWPNLEYVSWQYAYVHNVLYTATDTQHCYIQQLGKIASFDLEDGYIDPYVVTVDDDSTVNNDAVTANGPLWIEGPFEPGAMD